MPIERTLDKLERLLDLQETYEAYLNHIPVGLMVVNEWYLIEYTNERFRALCGYTKRELQHEHMSMVMPKDMRKPHKEHEREFERDPRERQGNQGLKPEIFTKAGKYIPVDISLNSMVIRGDRYHMASFRTIENLYESLGILF